MWPAKNSWVTRTGAALVCLAFLSACHRQAAEQSGIVLRSAYFDVDMPGASPLQNKAIQGKLEAILNQRGLACQSEPEYLQADDLEKIITVLQAAAQRDGWKWTQVDSSHTVWSVSSDPEMLVARDGKTLVVCLKLQPVSG